MMDLINEYYKVRQRTEEICRPLKTEDYVVQPVVDVSPPKWHLGHSAWFFETFILHSFLKGYKVFHADYNYVFNSYYETVGARVIRTDRGNLSRPGVEDIYKYRKHVDDAMEKLFSGEVTKELEELVILGLHHEQQHQELLSTDIKYILGHNPLFPAYDESFTAGDLSKSSPGFLSIPGGIYEVGYNGQGFCFDNECGHHKVYLNDFEMGDTLVTNGEYLEFMEQDGYNDHRHWHTEGLAWVKANDIRAPLYWHYLDGKWFHYTFGGLVPLRKEGTLCHISFYEASAFAAWKNMRLPTEFEWEAASPQLDYGKRWEWTNSAYLPYPGFKKAEGALGEYNGKFMVNQMVLRGASEVTPEGHSRPSYRNFFHPHLRWQYTGIRLAR